MSPGALTWSLVLVCLVTIVHTEMEETDSLDDNAPGFNEDFLSQGTHRLRKRDTREHSGEIASETLDKKRSAPTDKENTNSVVESNSDNSETDIVKRALPEFVGKRRLPEFVGKRRLPEFVGKRFRPEFVGKRLRPQFVGKRMRPEFVGKRMRPEFVGKRMRPEFVGKRRIPEFVGKRRIPEFVGKRMMPEFVGKRRIPEFVGKRRLPEFVGKRRLPEFVGKRRLPEFVGKRGLSDVPFRIRRSVSNSKNENPEDIFRYLLAYSILDENSPANSQNEQSHVSEAKSDAKAAQGAESNQVNTAANEPSTQV